MPLSIPRLVLRTGGAEEFGDDHPRPSMASAFLLLRSGGVWSWFPPSLCQQEGGKEAMASAPLSSWEVDEGGRVAMVILIPLPEGIWEGGHDSALLLYFSTRTKTKTKDEAEPCYYGHCRLSGRPRIQLRGRRGRPRPGREHEGARERRDRCFAHAPDTVTAMASASPSSSIPLKSTFRGDDHHRPSMSSALLLMRSGGVWSWLPPSLF